MRLLASFFWTGAVLLAVGPNADAAPKSYECKRTAEAVTTDGKLDEAAWQQAKWSDEFVDIEGDKKPKPRYRTRMKMLWDDQYLYIAAELEEPHVWGTLTKHDSVIFHDNDFEVFLNPTGDGYKYFEFEMNALNTGWDLFLAKPYREKGTADNSWEIPGLKTAVHVDGTLNNASDTDHGWQVEIAMPWSAFTERCGRGRPEPGSQWRADFSRVEWRTEIVDGQYRKLPGREDNWVWSPQGAIDMHRPATWGYIHFVK